MRVELVTLRDKITGDLSISRSHENMRWRLHYWRGYLAALTDVRRAGQCSITYAEYKAFNNALENYTGAFLSVTDDDLQQAADNYDTPGIEVIRESSPESPTITPCEGKGKVVKPMLFMDDPRTSIKLGGG